MIALPAVVYFCMLITCNFPVQERVSSGVSYRDMLSEFGILGAIVVGFLSRCSSWISSPPARS